MELKVSERLITEVPPGNSSFRFMLVNGEAIPIEGQDNVYFVDRNYVTFSRVIEYLRTNMKIKPEFSAG